MTFQKQKELQKKLEEKNKLKKISPLKIIIPTTILTSNAYAPKSGSSSRDIFKTPIAPMQNEKLNLIPFSKMKPNNKPEKSNLEILLTNDESANKVNKIGNLKMLSPWNFFDNRKIIFYKNLNFEYYDVDRNELKGTINLNSDFTVVKKDTFQFDLVAKGKVFSFISRKEEDIKDWVEVINKTIVESKRKWLRKSK